MTNSSKLILAALITSLLGLPACSSSPVAAPEAASTPAPTNNSTLEQTPSIAPPNATASPTELPTITFFSAKPQIVKIFLITLGDNGKSGKLIGCGDSLVPVEIALEPTADVLRATLIELLNLSSVMTPGQSGLYNALSLSELAIQELDIANGEAIIYLSGTLIIGGECNIPRIEAQLTETVLQFSNIDRASIFINDIPLEELLSLEG